MAPQQVIWSNQMDVILVQDEHIFKMNIFTKDIKEIGTRKPNDFVGIDKEGNIILCSIEHFVINSKDEYSTIFKIDEKELKFFPTIRPISFNGNTIIAVTALDILEQHYYEIDVTTGSIKEIPHPAYIKNRYEYIEEDVFGNTYLNYNPYGLLKDIVIHISEHLLDLTLQLLPLDKYQILTL